MAATLCGTAHAQSQAFTEITTVKSHSNPWRLVYRGAIEKNEPGKVNIHPITT